MSIALIIPTKADFTHKKAQCGSDQTEEKDLGPVGIHGAEVNGMNHTSETNAVHTYPCMNMNSGIYHEIPRVP